MITRDLKLYFVLACIPALLLSAIALRQLHMLSREREGNARSEVMERVRKSAAGTVFAGKANEAKEELERRASDFRKTLLDEFQASPPIGVFVWRPRDGVVCTNDVPQEVLREIDRISRISGWSDDEDPKHKKKPPPAGIRDFAGHCVLWARDGRRNGSLCGAVFSENPAEKGLLLVSLWPIGLALGVLLAGVLAAGAWLLVRAAAKARRDDLMKTTFLSNASHELKTPLAGIGVWAELLRSGRLATDERRAHAYDVIVAENARMVRLVENLLDFSRLEQGRRRYHMRDVDVAALAEDAVEVVRGEFAENGISLQSEGNCMAMADSDAVKQILLNLLGNAAKYAASGGAVEVDVRRDEEGGVRVAVMDRGPGLSAEAMEHVFERFWRADGALNSEKGGLGLGLAISHALAEDMDGTLSVTAREGGGCVFTLSIPAA